MGWLLDKLLSYPAWRALCWDLQIISPEVLRYLTPHEAYYVYLTVRTHILLPQHDCMDCGLQEEAQKLSKEIVFLDDKRLAKYSYLNTLFRSDDGEEVTAERLTKFLLGDPVATLRKELEYYYELAFQYERGDLQSIEEEVMKSEYEDLIKGRNEEWMVKLIPQLEKGDVFIAIGIGHMTGPSSLVKLLEANGYMLSRWSL